MVRFASDDDKSCARVLESWQQTAIDEIDEIGAAERARLTGQWESAPEKTPAMFLSQTTFLVGWIARKLPSLNPEPLQHVYDAVKAWHDGRRPEPYDRLERILEQAIIVMGAAWDEIYSRALHEIPRETPPDPAYLGLNVDRENRAVATGTKVAHFGKKQRPWQLFAALYHAKESGKLRNELIHELCSTLDESNLDKWKSALDELLMPLRINVSVDGRGVWKLAAL